MPKSQRHRQIIEAEVPDIIVYPIQRRLVGWIVLSGVPSLCCLLVTIGMIILMVANSNIRAQNGAVVTIILFFASLSALGIWQTYLFLRILFSKEPILAISHAGIRVGKIYGFSDIFLPWEEVEAVYCRINPPYTLLCIRPVENELFFARLSPMMRFTCRLSAMSGAPIALYQSFLDQPIAEILVQMQTCYKREMKLYQAKKQIEKTPHPANENHDIMLYAPRLLLWTPILMGLALLFGLLTLFMTPRQLSTLFMGVFLILSGACLGPIWLWRTLRTPLLVIDEEGIASPRLLKGRKIKWEEIACLSGETGGFFSVDTSPSGTIAWLARQRNGKLVIPRHVDITLPQTVVSFPQRMLPLPIDRLLEQISERFQYQLKRYKIELDYLQE